MGFVATAIGAAAGYSIGGPIGAVFGLIAGRAVDSITARWTAQDADEDLAPEQVRRADRAVIVLAIEVAQAEGAAGPKARAAVQRLVLQLGGATRGLVDPHHPRFQLDALRAAADQEGRGAEAHAAALARLLRDRPAMLEGVIDTLLSVAGADATISPALADRLEAIAQDLGVSARSFRRQLRAYGGVTAGTASGVLGLPTDAPMAEVREAYRRLVQHFHPDRLIAEGAPAEDLAYANQRLRVIHAAWQSLRDSHGPARSRGREGKPQGGGASRDPGDTPARSSRDDGLDLSRGVVPVPGE